MKLVYPDFEQQILLEENMVNVLHIENPEYYVQIIQELNNQINGEEGKFVLSENEKIYPIKKNVDIIINPFNLDFGNKKFINAIYTELQEIAQNETNYKSTSETISILMNYIVELVDKVDYPLSINDNIDIVELFKCVNLKLNCNEGGLIEQLVSYIELLNGILRIKLVVLVDIKRFMAEKTYLLFIETLLAKKINILLLENGNNYFAKEYERVIIIDKDLCELGQNS
jgi:CRISPR-associated protein Csn2